mmetsp:Transcript_22569/g.49225  ORF Transcript_22569/g.49225 Transcript_22569/m.49225 type:complete len:455 (-) Transcript_22569:92-1456(-)|eukprot:CAMPEP_0168814360 /NCGR_PEP_ID=MMETSP0726-20121227/5639_1 /TAXON_ID=265536 /ORGANISM="Amphiprora sp., Strain CCMP467" /LENGTH=454 /DNA_ID=CAMNT_0008866529 /DNA_START=58 /DNA_END=1422 /DNA_ORIENTATION=-
MTSATFDEIGCHTSNAMTSLQKATAILAKVMQEEKDVADSKNALMAEVEQLRKEKANLMLSVTGLRNEGIAKGPVTIGQLNAACSGQEENSPPMAENENKNHGQDSPHLPTMDGEEPATNDPLTTPRTLDVVQNESEDAAPIVQDEKETPVEKEQDDEDVVMMDSDEEESEEEEKDEDCSQPLLSNYIQTKEDDHNGKDNTKGPIDQKNSEKETMQGHDSENPTDPEEEVKGANEASQESTQKEAMELDSHSTEAKNAGEQPKEEATKNEEPIIENSHNKEDDNTSPIDERKDHEAKEDHETNETSKDTTQKEAMEIDSYTTEAKNSGQEVTQHNDSKAEATGANVEEDSEPFIFTASEPNSQMTEGDSQLNSFLVEGEDSHPLLTQCPFEPAYSHDQTGEEADETETVATEVATAGRKRRRSAKRNNSPKKWRRMVLNNRLRSIWLLRTNNEN